MDHAGTRALILKFFLMVGLILATYVVFAQVTQHDFVDFDDPEYVLENMQVQGGLTLSGILWALQTTTVSNWHPLTWMSHMLDWTLYKGNAGGHHLTSLLLHLGNTLLLFLTLVRMTGALGRSAFVAALFALHPLHVESVAWIAERKDVLSTFFWLLTMWLYVRYTEVPGWGRYGLVGLSLALGLMAKPMLVTLPCVLLLLDYWPLGRLPADSPAAVRRAVVGRLVREKLPWFVLAVLSSLVTFVVQQQSGAMRALQGDFTLPSRLANACLAYVMYLGKMVWPHRLAVYYPHPVMVPLWQWGSAAVGLVGLSVLLLRVGSTRPYVTVGWLWFLGTLVPVIGLVQVGGQGLADRYTYVPLVGLFLILSWGLVDLAAHWRWHWWVLPALGGSVLVGLMLGTWRQVGYWRNTLTLFEHTLAVTERNHVAHLYVGMALARQGQTAEALAHYTAALSIVPGLSVAHMEMGIVLGKLNRPDEALEQYLKALQGNRQRERIHLNLAVELAKQGQEENAIAHLRAALQINPAYWRAYHHLGWLLLHQGKQKEAVQHYLEAIRLNPHDIDLRVKIGMNLLTNGLFIPAAHLCQEAVRMAPALAQAHYCAGMANWGAGDEAAATQAYNRLRSLAPDLATDLFNHMYPEGASR